jgi:WD40 repeat protein
VLGAVFSDTWSADGTARLWDAATGQEVLPPLRHEDLVRGAVFSDDENRILTWSDDKTARLWDAATGQEMLPPLRHKRSMGGADFSDDENRILTWSDDGTARLWDAATGQEVLPPLRHEDAVWGAAFSDDESRILTWSDDGTARLWDISRLPRGHLIQIACRLLPNHETMALEEHYGIAITEPICGPETPAPLWTNLKD